MKNNIKCSVFKRIEDETDVDMLVLEGDFLNQHREGILNLINQVTQLEIKNYPLEKIIAVKDSDKKIEIKTSNQHIAIMIRDSINKTYND